MYGERPCSTKCTPASASRNAPVNSSRSVLASRTRPSSDRSKPVIPAAVSRTADDGIQRSDACAFTRAATSSTSSATVPGAGSSGRGSGAGGRNSSYASAGSGSTRSPNRAVTVSRCSGPSGSAADASRSRVSGTVVRGR